MGQRFVKAQWVIGGIKFLLIFHVQFDVDLIAKNIHVSLS